MAIVKALHTEFYLYSIYNNMATKGTATYIDEAGTMWEKDSLGERLINEFGYRYGTKV